MLKTKGLSHLYFLLKLAIKKHIIYINLLKLPIMSQDKSKNDSNGGWLHNRLESSIKIEAKLSMISISIKLGFILIYNTFRILFHFEHPPTSSRLSMSRKSC